MMPAPAPAAPPMQVPPGVVTIDAVMRLLRDNALRKFRIDIEADSTISGDESREKQDRAELIMSITKLVEVWGPICTAQPIMAPLAAELMKFGVRAFRVGRPLEQIIEETADKLEEAMGQPKPPPQPSPDELIKLEGTKAKTAAEITKAQIGVEQAKIDAQGKIMSHHADMAAISADQQASAHQGAIDHALAEQKARHDAASHQMKAELEQLRYDRAVEAQNKPAKGDS